MAARRNTGSETPNLAELASAIQALLAAQEAPKEPTQSQEPIAEVEASGQPLCGWKSGNTVCGKPVAYRRDGQPKRWCSVHAKASREAWKANVKAGAEVTAARRAENEVIAEAIMVVVDAAPKGQSPKATKVRVSPAGSSFCYYLVKEGYAERDGFAVTVTLPSLPKAKAFVKALGESTFEQSSKPTGEIL